MLGRGDWKLWMDERLLFLGSQKENDLGTASKEASLCNRRSQP